MTSFAPATLWALAGIVLLIAELVVPGVFLMWLALAALGVAAFAAWIATGIGIEIVVFTCLATASVMLGRRAVRRRPEGARVGADLVGRRVVARHFAGRDGRVRLGDSEWPARLEAGASCAEGAGLRVTAVEGTVLVVAAEDGAILPPG